LQHQANTVVGRLRRLHVDAVHEAHAMLLARQRETARELVDVAGRIGCREIAAVVAALQRRFDPGDFFRADRMALQPTRYQQGVGFAGRCEARLVVIEVQDATSLQVEIDLLTFCHREQMLARVDGHARGFDRVVAIVGDAGDELADPGILVPRQPAIRPLTPSVLGPPARSTRTSAPDRTFKRPLRTYNGPTRR
jgi:hypothetical protein